MKLSLFFVFNAFAALLSAQSISPVWSEISKTSRVVSEYGIIDTDSSGFYTLEEITEKKLAIQITRYSSKDLKQEWNNKIDLPQIEGCEQRFESIYHLSTHFLLFTTGFDKESNHYQAYATFIDNNGKSSSSSVLIHSCNGNGNIYPTFDVDFSPDKNKLLVLFNPPFDRKSKENISLKVYTPDLDLVWDKELELPYEQDIIQVQNFLIDNDGGLFLMSGKNPEKSGTNWQRPQGNRYVVFHYDIENNKLKEYDISLKEKRVVSVQYDLNKKGELVIAGYYANGFNFSVSGTFLFTLNSHGESIKTAAFMAFPKDFLTNFMKESRAEKDGALDNFFLDHLIINSDSSYTLIGEQYYISEQLMTDISTGRQYIQTSYNFDDLIVSRVKADGRIDWSVKVPKRQYSNSNNLQASYACYLENDLIKIYFNDNSDNTDRLASFKEGDALGWSGTLNSITAEVAIDPDGKMSRKTLVSNKEMDVLLKPIFCNPNSYGVPVLGYQQGKSFRFCLLP